MRSTLINTVFGVDVAKISDTTPQTQEFTMYKGVDYKKQVNLIDSKGYELDDTVNSYVNKANKYIEFIESKGQKVHISWFTISVAGTRIEPMDSSVLEKMLQISALKGRLGVVLTKCDEDDENGSIAKEFKRVLQEQFPSIPVFETSNDPQLQDELDIEELILWSANAIDEEDVRSCFITSQRYSLDLIKESVQKYVLAYAASAGAVGAVPIPFADSALLVPIQLIMVVQITNKYGMENLEAVAGGMISNLVVSQIGKTLASNLIKFIPGVGALVGGAINAAVASSITYAMGMIMSEICYKSCKDTLDGKEVDFQNLFSNDIVKQGFKKFYDEYGGK